MGEGRTVFVIDENTAERIASLEAKVDQLLAKFDKREPAEFDMPEFGFMRIDQVLEVIPIGKSTWRLWVSEGKAPQGIFLSPRVKVWGVKDIRAFAEKIKAGGLSDEATS